MADMTRSEQLLNAIATGEPSGVTPQTRREKFLAYIAGESATLPKAYTREEKLLAKICENGAGGGGGGGETTEPGKPYIDSGKITNFDNFIRYSPLLIDDLDKLDTSRGTTFISMFNGCSNLITIPPLDTSNGTSFNFMFNGCYGLTTIPPLDTSNGTNFYNTFYGCSGLTTIPPLDTSNGTNFAGMFAQCTDLNTLALTTAKADFDTNTFLNCYALRNITIGEGWAVSIYLNYSNNLTVESLHGMIENLADLTGQTAKVFKVGATNRMKIDEDHLAMLDAKNWEYS